MMMGYGGAPPHFMYNGPPGMMPPSMMSSYGAWGPSLAPNPGAAINARAMAMNQKQEQHYRDVEGAVVGRINKQSGRGKGRPKV